MPRHQRAMQELLPAVPELGPGAAENANVGSIVADWHAIQTMAAGAKALLERGSDGDPLGIMTRAVTGCNDDEDAIQGEAEADLKKRILQGWPQVAATSVVDPRTPAELAPGDIIMERRSTALARRQAGQAKAAAKQAQRKAKRTPNKPLKKH
mmetsp:Transcript_62827/g.144698  ORF Transcript_62827/g.144698 Transcript_62827/m.144698 type:complete len:153 (+) Transcript_62827:29-487(+)